MTDAANPAAAAAPAATDAAAAAAAAPAAPDAAAAAAPAAPDSPKAYRPQGLPDDVAGATDQETIDKLFRQNAGFRKSMSERGTVPETPDAYNFTFEGDLAPYGEQLKNDPVMAGARKLFHDLGITDKAASQLVPGFFKMVGDLGLLDAPFDANKEMAALFPDEKDPSALKAATAKAVNEAVATLAALKQTGMPEGAAKLIEAQLDRADGVRLVQYMAGLGQPRGPLTDGGAPGAVTRAQLEARLADPRNQVGNLKYDQAFVDETNRLYAQLPADAA